MPYFEVIIEVRSLQYFRVRARDEEEVFERVCDGEALLVNDEEVEFRLYDIQETPDANEVRTWR